MKTYKNRKKLELNIKNARSFAEDTFKQLPHLDYQWNIIHSESIIEVLRLLRKNIEESKDVNLNKLFAIAYVHDIGKVISIKKHQEYSIRILEEKFIIDDITKDTILNHGSKGKPKTKEGKLFRYADGLSIFTLKSTLFIFYSEGIKKKDFYKIFYELKRLYNKYRIAYSDSKEILRLLKELYRANVMGVLRF